jgi:PadR family transcriptional regulator PadR
MQCELMADKGGRFIQPCILLSLIEQPLHGYGLLEHIMAFGFSDDPIDISVIYRHLKRMEEIGFISFTWDTDTSGPARKVYQITGDGIEALKSYEKLMKHKKNRIEAFLDKYKKQMGGL